MRQLRGEDARFVYAETGHANSNITLVHIYDPSTAPGGRVRFKGLLKYIESRLHLSPVFRQRLLRVREHLRGEEVFLANYADGLSDLPLDEHIADFRRKNVTASFAAVRSWQTFHTVRSADDGIVTGIGQLGDADFLINGGYFVLRQSIFDVIEEGEELVEQPFQRLIDRRQLGVYRYLGFWRSMDTFKDKITLDRMEARGDCPWMLWKKPQAG